MGNRCLWSFSAGAQDLFSSSGGIGWESDQVSHDSLSAITWLVLVVSHLPSTDQPRHMHESLFNYSIQVGCIYLASHGPVVGYLRTSLGPIDRCLAVTTYTDERDTESSRHPMEHLASC